MKTVKQSILCLALVAATVAPLPALAGVKTYDFPGVQESIVDSQGVPVEGVRLDFTIRLRERKFWGWALFPPVEWLACGLGKALGGVIGGWFGGPHAPPKSCWQLWAEDLGLKPIEDVAEYDSPVTDAAGLAKYAPRRIYVASPVHSFTPGLVIQASKLEIPFEFTSTHTPSARLVCGKSFAEPTCAIAVPGKKRIAAVSKDGLACVIPMTAEQLTAMRTAAVETCRERVIQAESFYSGSYPAMFGPTVSADANR